jgi:ribosome-binding protein aMBF1 (putative translation factor)
MKCERCLKGKDAKYRVRTDLINLKVCAACAEEAGRLGIAVEVLDRRQDKDNQDQSEFGIHRRQVKLSA